MDYLLRGILIGLLFGLPVGVVGAMTVQRTLIGGIKAGLFTGLGSSVADCFYACVGVFGFTIISDFMLKYKAIINILGGSFILFMGIRLLLKKNNISDIPKLESIGLTKMFLSSFVIGITNPAAILTFLFAFSYFGISGNSGIVQGILIVCGVFIGTYIWWTILSAITNIIKKRMAKYSFIHMNQICGIILFLFGAAIFLSST